MEDSLDGGRCEPAFSSQVGAIPPLATHLCQRRPKSDHQLLAMAWLTIFWQCSGGLVFKLGRRSCDCAGNELSHCEQKRLPFPSHGVALLVLSLSESFRTQSFRLHARRPCRRRVCSSCGRVCHRPLGTTPTQLGYLSASCGIRPRRTSNAFRATGLGRLRMAASTWDAASSDGQGAQLGGEVPEGSERPGVGGAWPAEVRPMMEQSPAVR